MSSWLQKHLILSLTFIMLLAGCSGNNQAAAPANPTAASANTASGESATIQLVASDKEPAVEITVSNVKQLYAVELELTFEASKLKIVDADSQKEGVQLKPGVAPVPDFNVKNEVKEGSIHYVVTQIAPREGFNGSGVVATITLQEKLSDPTAIAIKSAILVNQDGQPITATIQK
jgi:hypothetical protein